MARSQGAPDLHINNVNAYHSRLKQWLRRFNGVATKNLSHYFGWRRTLETVDDTDPQAQWLGRAMGLGADQQLRIRREISDPLTPRFRAMLRHNFG